MPEFLITITTIALTLTVISVTALIVTVMFGLIWQAIQGFFL